MRGKARLRHTEQPNAFTDERGFTTQYEYDAQCGCSRRVTKIIDPLGKETRFTYDANGNQATVTDALERVTTFTYDANDRHVLTTFADGSTEQFFYDALDRLVAQTDPAGQTTWFGYVLRTFLTSYFWLKCHRRLLGSRTTLPSYFVAE